MQTNATPATVFRARVNRQAAEFRASRERRQAEEERIRLAEQRFVPRVVLKHRTVTPPR